MFLVKKRSFSIDEIRKITEESKKRRLIKEELEDYKKADYIIRDCNRRILENARQGYNSIVAYEFSSYGDCISKVKLNRITKRIHSYFYSREYDIEIKQTDKTYSPMHHKYFYEYNLKVSW